MARYDPTILQQLADQLYARANTIIMVMVMMGALGGAFFGYTALAVLSDARAGGLLGLIIGGFVGNAVGQGRAFQLRVQAQLLLVQLQIEANTSRSAAPSSPRNVPDAAARPAAATSVNTAG